MAQKTDNDGLSSVTGETHPLLWAADKLKKYAYSVIGTEILSSAKYFDRVIQWDSKETRGLRVSLEKQKISMIQSSSAEDLRRSAGASLVLLDGNINHSTDIQGLLSLLKSALNRSSRILAVVYNPYYKIVFQILNFLGLRQGDLPTTFLSRTALQNLAQLAGFEVCRVQPILQFPFKLVFVGPILNAFLRAVPFLRWTGFAAVITLRPVVQQSEPLSLSIVIPARNESGNIDHVLSRLMSLEHLPVEVIFVEGHSKDDTWEKIQRVMREYRGPFKLTACQQSGKGKKNAVKEGFEKATGDLLTILDADLTMPPEMLIRFYQAYSEGKGDFINGSRLLYPMEVGSMQFLNHLGNIFFAKALSFVTDTSLTDSLCGTKLLSRIHYECVSRWCQDFGDFDPFGDFELIFPAAVLGLGAIDVPIRYQARTYGTTNISRFQHGWQLLRMTFIGLFTFKMGRMRHSNKSYSSPDSEAKGF